MTHVYVHEVEVGESAMDANGHVNNVEFVRWMNDAAVAHSDERGCTAATRAAGATWVVRSHRVEYRRPAFAGDRVRVTTWVGDVRRAFSLRKYRIVRAADDTLLAEAESDFVFVDAASGRPRSIPADIMSLFEQMAAGHDPPVASDRGTGSTSVE